MEEKLKVTVNELKATQNKLKEEEEITADLRLRLKNNTKKVLPWEKPSVIVITDRNSGDIFESLDSDNIKWELKLIETLNKLKGGMDEKMITYLIKFDLVLIMLARNDIQSGKDFIKLSEDLEEVITLISDLGVEVRPIQILPRKGVKYRTDIRFFNEGIIDNYSGKSIRLDNIFRKMNDQEIFIRTKTTVKVELLQKVKDEIVAQTGTPDIPYKTQPPVPAPGAISQKSHVELSENTDVTNDDEIITEFLPVSGKHTGFIIGKQGESDRNLQALSGAKIQIIEYIDKDEPGKRAALIMGNIKERLDAKINTAKSILNGEQEQQWKRKPFQSARSNNDEGTALYKKMKN